MMGDTEERGGDHPFEAAGLGKHPYKLLRVQVLQFKAAPGEPTKPGGSCDYCGTAIVNAYVLMGSCGNTFKVGCDCVAKSTHKGDPMRIQVGREARRMQREAKRKRDAKRIATTVSMLMKLETRRRLREQPHPHRALADKGRTKLDWATWMLRQAGTSGRLRVAREIL